MASIFRNKRPIKIWPQRLAKANPIDDITRYWFILKQQKERRLAGDIVIPPTDFDQFSFVGAYKGKTDVQNVAVDGDILNLMPKGIMSVLGADLITNGTFDSALTGWAAGDWTWAAGTAVAGGASTLFSQSGLVTTGAGTCTITFTGSAPVDGNQVRVAMVSGQWSVINLTTTPTQYSVDINNDPDSGTVWFYNNHANVVIDNITIQEHKNEEGATSDHSTPILALDYEGVYQEYPVDAPVWQGGRIDGGETLTTLPDGSNIDPHPWLQANDALTNFGHYSADCTLMVASNVTVNRTLSWLDGTPNVGSVVASTSSVSDKITTASDFIGQGDPAIAIIWLEKAACTSTHCYIDFDGEILQFNPQTGIASVGPYNYVILDLGTWWKIGILDINTSDNNPFITIYPDRAGVDGAAVGIIQVEVVGTSDLGALSSFPPILTTASAASISKVDYIYPAANINPADMDLKFQLLADGRDCYVLNIGGVPLLTYGTIDPWVFLDPVGDCSTSNTATEKTITVPSGTSHDMWGLLSDAPRLTQDCNDTDFVVEILINTGGVYKTFYGFIIQETTTKYYRFNIAYDGIQIIRNMDEVVTELYSVPSVHPYIKVVRVGDLFTFYSSADGVSWDELLQDTQTLVVTSVGLLVGNWGGGPTVLAKFEYFKVDDLLEGDASSPSGMFTDQFNIN